TLQKPRVPVWVATSWPSRKPLERAARWDGVVPCAAAGLEIDPADIRKIVSFVRARRDVDRGFDVTRFGKTRDPRDTGIVEACAEAGATWWIEYVYTWESSLEATRARLRQGPPRL